MRPTFGTTFHLAGFNRHLGRSDSRRQRHADCLEYLAAATFGPAAHRDRFSVIGNRHLPRGFQIPLDIFPFESFTGPIQSLIQFLAQNQGQERTKHMAPDCFITLIEMSKSVKKFLTGV